MKTWAFLISFLALSTAFGESLVAQTSLSAEDQQIYQETLQKCLGGSAVSALRTGLSAEIVQSASVNLVKIMMLDLQASTDRWNSHMLSPETYRLRHSQGFFQALAVCYGEKSPMNRNLYKNLIDLGHLTSEVTGTVTSLYALGRLAVLSRYMQVTYPVFAKYSVFVSANLAMYGLYQKIKTEYFQDASVDEQKQLNEIDANLFSNADQALVQVKKMVQLKIQSIEAKLDQADTTQTQRERWMTQRNELLELWQKL